MSDCARRFVIRLSSVAGMSRCRVSQNLPTLGGLYKIHQTGLLRRRMRSHDVHFAARRHTRDGRHRLGYVDAKEFQSGQRVIMKRRVPGSR